MMEKTHELPHTKSPVRKRARSSARARKKYFFQPKNTLAFNPAPSNTLQNSPIRSKEALNPVQPNHAVPEYFEDATNATSSAESQQLLNGTPPTSHSNADAFFPSTTIPKILEKSNEQQSSDDSFDGVRWRPASSPQKTSRPILSSPLKTVEAITKEQPFTSFVNEVTDSMLSKYGMVLPNTITQTPKYARTRSDGFFATSDTSPTLTRSKSFDPKSLPSQHRNEIRERHPSESKLNSWIDKFDDSYNPHRPIDACSLDGQDHAHDDTLCSDDDIILANLKCESVPPILHSQSASELKSDQAVCHTSTPAHVEVKNQNTQPEPQCDNSDLTDPFSDDLDISALDNLNSQPASVQASFSKFSDDFNKPVTTKSKIFTLSSLQNVTVNDRKASAKLSYSRSDFARYVVKDVLHSTYTMKTFKKKQLVLTVLDQSDSTTKIIVRGEAAELSISPSDIIHIIYTVPENPRLVSDSHNLLIWNPDTLVSSTVVADQLFCPRKTVLSRRLAGRGLSSIPLLTGSIVHEIFQICLISRECSHDYMEMLVDIELQRRLLEIYSLGDVLEELRANIASHLPKIRQWIQTFVNKVPSEISTNRRQQKAKFSVAEVIDVEESIWSPMFGIKGIADVTLKANIDSDISKSQIMLPMEIKTARPSVSHQAQAALYSLLFKDRYDVDISSALLVYTSNEGSTTKYDISASDLKSLVNLRNRISKYLRAGNQDLPDLMRQQQCDRCFLQESCMTYNFLTENGTSEESGLKDDIYKQITHHLKRKSKYKDFLTLWDTLLTKEEEFASRFNEDLWVMSTKEREETQKTSIGDLVICEQKPRNDTDYYIYMFRRRSAKETPLNASQIQKYDKVIISDEIGHFCLSSGFVRHIEPDCITIAAKRQIITRDMKTFKFGRTTGSSQGQNLFQRPESHVSFRIDKDEIFYGMGVARFNILNLFLASGDHLRRKLIVDLEPPRFESTPQFAIDNEDDHFNESQLIAFDKVSKTKDYSLILGMPGTGKTTVIAHIIKMMVRAKKTVLLTSYTNSAVDNILLKVKTHGIDFLRIGNQSRIHPAIREYTADSLRNQVNNFEDFQNVYLKPYVVAATCLSACDIAFNVRNHFDYCIVDEASQVSMPLSLGPIALCDKFILVGDHFQLPPLVAHPNPQIKAGLSQSLFEILALAHPSSIVELGHQYRMCEDIMLISNRLVYQNRLICGSDGIANQSLPIPNEKNLSQVVRPGHTLDGSWLQHALNPKKRVVVFDHTFLSAWERTVGENITNLIEVELIRQTVEGLILCGVDPIKIGIMTLYRSQLRILLDTFRHVPQLEILTADRFQGRDKECIIISMVRSNKERKTGELLKDWRRINVAVTRARSKLLIFGSVPTLKSAQSMAGFISLAEEQGWIFNLPENAAAIFHFKRPAAHNEPNENKSKVGSKAIGRHPLVRDILADMSVN